MVRAFRDGEFSGRDIRSTRRFGFARPIIPGKMMIPRANDKGRNLRPAPRLSLDCKGFLFDAFALREPQFRKRMLIHRLEHRCPLGDFVLHQGSQRRRGAIRSGRDHAAEIEQALAYALVIERLDDRGVQFGDDIRAAFPSARRSRSMPGPGTPADPPRSWWEHLAMTGYARVSPRHRP